VNYLYKLSDDETTSELRRHNEDRFKEDEQIIEANKADYLEKFKEINNLHVQAEQQTDIFKNDFIAFRKEKTETEVKHSMHEIIPGLDISQI